MAPVESTAGTVSSSRKDLPADGRHGAFRRSFRMLLSAVVLLAATTAAGVGAAPAYAAVPEDHQQNLWQHACVDVARGDVSPQEALVCVHSGVPQWIDRVLAVVQRICERPLGGTFEYRSEYPIELAACFFP